MIFAPLYFHIGDTLVFLTNIGRIYVQLSLSYGADGEAVRTFFTITS